LPFVFAAWVSVNPLPQEFIKLFDEANAVGISRIDDIVRENPYELYDMKKYYTLHLSYGLDEQKRRGMEKFLEVITEKEFHDMA
jgi:chorismate dehydratase